VSALLWLAAASLGVRVAEAQSTVPQPAESARGRAGDSDAARSARLPSWRADVTGDAGSGALREEELIGAYQQPRWTAKRRFPTTRIYVRPAGTFQFEWWHETKLSLKDADDVRHRSLFEV
jgi:hypothetical protein